MPTDNLVKPAYAFLKKYRVIGVRLESAVISIYHEKSAPDFAIAELIRFYITRYPMDKITTTIVSDSDFNTQLKETFESHNNDAITNVDSIEEALDLSQLAEAIPEAEDLLEQENEAPIIRLINGFLSEAVKLNASDIHIETYERKMIIRFRIDGSLLTIVEPKRTLAPLLISRIKIMAKLDIAEKRIPQDGRISIKIAGKDIDIRVSTLPSNDNERVVMRILDKKSGEMPLSSLGMSEVIEKHYKKLLSLPHGIILITGPTGSGKTTSLYSGLSHINNQERNILTIEDPIEYQLEGIGQTQVNTKTNMTFARGLRAILRQDPDVVMIGEIRDKETADIAVQASLTGHLVVSSLHTNTAIGAITRLRDMGVEPFLISSSTVGIMAQRLVRKLCIHCKKSKEPDSYEENILTDASQPCEKIYVATGCKNCKQTGYLGRTGIYELIVITEKLKSLIHENSSEQELLEIVRQHSKSMRHDGIRLVTSGITTIDEVIRVTHA